ncbi:NAD(P)-dependent oxidoreductase [Clostridium guangxiense]|uniref:NAD(P)-dependent oxidoreductase n=1 Tax=Clostridium guangxiense TaxID=1662055 RepID=UPI001E2D467A|nr:NAD(P)-dependent oxidoreductase [Clostridium guangxiense]MCD2347715.1 NAD(P)-binding domain-containing protein [Clostridium guangxiense]
MNLLSTFDFGKEKMDCIKRLGIEVTLIDGKKIGEICNCNDFEVIVCNNFFKYFDISKFGNLKWVQLVSSGVDAVPIQRLKRAGVILTNCKGAYSIPIAEWVITKILEIYKSSKKFYKLQDNRKWEKYEYMYELNNKKASILGTGSIGVEIAKRLKSFGVEITGINSTGMKIKFFKKCFAMQNINNVLNVSDIVINTLPLTVKTINLINDAFFANMKAKSIFVNVSRGKILDEKALIKYLKSGHLLGAALDVFELEPLPPNDPLWLLNNLIITPHVSYRSDIGNQRVFEIVFENLIRYKNGEELINKVDYVKGY